MLGHLSPAEMRILQSLGNGASNRTISEAVGQSEAIVKSLVRSLMVKLHFRNRTEAGVFAFRARADIERLLSQFVREEDLRTASG